MARRALRGLVEDKMDEYILPQDRSLRASHCRQLIEKIKAGELDEFDLKNEINAQWNKGYSQGAKPRHENIQALLDSVSTMLDEEAKKKKLYYVIHPDCSRPPPFCSDIAFDGFKTIEEARVYAKKIDTGKAGQPPRDYVVVHSELIGFVLEDAVKEF